MHNSDNDSLHMMTKEEVAEIFGVNPTTIQTWMGNGWIPYVKIGSTVRILRGDLNDAIKEHTFIGKSSINQ